MKPVLIAGGGIGGMTLAHALKKARVPFLLLEQAKDFRRMGGGIGLWGPSLKALKQLDLEHKLQGRMMSCAGYRKDSQIECGDWLVRPSNYTGMLKRHTSCLCLLRGDLQEVLYQSLDKEDILLGAKVVYFADSRGQDVMVHTEDGRVISGSMLVGTDGVDSVVRQQIFPQVTPQPCGYYYWQGVGTTDASTVEIGYKPSDEVIPAYEAWGTRVRVGVVPLSQQQNFWFVCSDEIIHKDNLERAVREFGPTVQALVGNTLPEDVFSSELMDVTMPRGGDWGAGRVVCLGDAVHAMAPNLAQGACLAIEDALLLAHHIKALQTRAQAQAQITAKGSSAPFHSDIESTFRQFARARKFRTRVVQVLVPWVHKVGSLSSPLLVAVRNVMFSLFPARVKSVVFDITHQFALGWSYTAPNLGQGLYHRLLSREFLVENPILYDFHELDVDRYCCGSVDVIKGEGFLAKLLGALMMLPPSCKHGKVEVAITTSTDGSELWERTFTSPDGVCTRFTTLQDIKEECLIEMFGPFVFEFRVVISGKSSFDLELERFSIGTRYMCISMPKWLSPRVTGSTVHDPKVTGWNFCVVTNGPLWSERLLGLIFKYEGCITEVKRK